MGMTVASTGASEKVLKRVGIPYRKVYTHGNNHAGYYPGAGVIDIKLLFSPTVSATAG
jgi:NADPH-dependent 2,4-dienoyl-CoA reductase/sulfur reductase-like enzyme